MELLYHITILALTIGTSFCYKDEQQLLTDLFKEYNLNARPSLYKTDVVNVTIDLSLNQIVDVHEKDQVLLIRLWIRQRWNNPHLAWDSLKYDNITDINVEPELVWKPDIVLYNNADDDNSFGGNLARLNNRIKLSYNGDALWLTAVILKAKCSIDVTYFPFDTQICKLKFGSWTYSTSQLDLFPIKKTVDLGSYLKNSEWRLNSAIGIRNVIKYSCCPGSYGDVTYFINISRRSLFYVCNLIFPMSIIVLMTILSFLLPAESGERVSLVITLLLAMTVFMLVVTDIIPATSDVMPLVGIFYSLSMLEMVVMIVVLCYIMRLYHKEASDKPMPVWMRRYILDWLSYKLGIRVREGDEEKEADGKKGNIFSGNKKFNNNISKQMSRSRSMSGFKNGSGTLASIINNRNTSIENNFKINNNNREEKLTVAELLNRKVDIIVNRVKLMEHEDEIKTEWRIVAMTIDRCLLLSFTAVAFITIFTCFSQAPGFVL